MSYFRKEPPGRRFQAASTAVRKQPTPSAAAGLLLLAHQLVELMHQLVHIRAVGCAGVLLAL